MAQPSSLVLKTEHLDRTDSRKYFVEQGTHPHDFASGEFSLLLATVPFLPAGDNFSDIPLYPVGLTQSFSWNEGLVGTMVPEIGSSRKTNTAGSSAGSGVVSKIVVHGSSLSASLYRPTLQFIMSTETLSPLKNKIMNLDGNPKWISGLLVQDVDLFSVEMTEFVDRVIAAGGMNSLLYKIPFGLLEIRRDSKQRVLSINFFEQCGIRGNQGGLSAGQQQLMDSFSFEFERVRPLTAVGPFSLSDVGASGLPADS